jgi:2-hydroxychromene-2-carboxylate isomerase
VTVDDLPEKVCFWFDPSCPWTWLTSRWLVGVAERGGIEVEWRPLSLPVIRGGGDDLPEDKRREAEGSKAAHRVFEALLRSDRTDDVRALYEEIGRRVHHDGEAFHPELVVAAAEAVGLPGEVVAATDDASLDDAARRDTEAACALAGPEVGSPVLSFDDPPVGVFGPILTELPGDVEAAMVFEAAVLTARVPQFSELKRGRTKPPRPGPLP